MEEPKRDAEMRTPSYSAPFLPENAYTADVPAPFSASLPEKILAFVMYIAAYLYICEFSGWNNGAFLPFCALFVAMTEWRFHAQRPSAESWIWLGCLVVTAVSAPLGRNRVWGELSPLFLQRTGISPTSAPAHGH